MPSLNVQIFISAVLGLIVGGLVTQLGDDSVLRADILYSTGLLGSIFIDLLKMVLIPLVFTTIVVGVANLQEHNQIHKVWTRTLAFFVLTMGLAMTVSLVAMNIFHVGEGMHLSMFQDAMANYEHKKLTPSEFLVQFLHHIFQNPFSALAKGEVLPVVVFAMFLGVALIVSGERSKNILNLFKEFLDLVMRMIGWIMKLAPLGIFALLLKLVATQNSELLTTLIEFIVLIIGTTLFHGIVVLPSLLYIFTKKSPLWFWRGSREALVTAFATSSSTATLPVTLRCAEQHLHVRKDIAGFVVPLGATLNMDGTALYEAAAALFVANLAGIDLSLGQQLIVFVTAMIASMGAPGIPSAGMVTMILVLQSVGLPVEAIAILLPIDRLLDTVRTAVNVQGDMISSLVVQELVLKTEEKSA
ncbi:MAG: dicarboxylate/amino acid:cation symporter [Gammaproteobacteria bacterium]|nr:MAG: dicarboxylate/amino acid:cation symporter [Gammaproteobacteria bacterium]